MSLCSSYKPNYFSIDDILATEERLSCKVLQKVPRLGFMDHSSESKDLKPGTKLELSFWLAYSMNKSKDPIASIDIPKYYKESYREILNADACAIELSKWNTYFYEFGLHVAKFDHPDCEKLPELLLKTFKSRFRLVMDWAQNQDTNPMIASQLPMLERTIFLSGRKSKEQLVYWFKIGGGGIKTTELIANHKKRKRSTFIENER
ncbi:DNA replication complex GINS protein PSF3 [Cephus cinctus]|uniref:DNA replication complex GINS protein PSF3 n=1 Tax=Cephus cinctus TaxID=211228 RepID=A0AAJ7CGL4_CEPCN|nr:DNA replication complex GINS protein PSF3 [Cephus cinctus]